MNDGFLRDGQLVFSVDRRRAGQRGSAAGLGARVRTAGRLVIQRQRRK